MSQVGAGTSVLSAIGTYTARFEPRSRRIDAAADRGGTAALLANRRGSTQVELIRFDTDRMVAIKERTGETRG